MHERYRSRVDAVKTDEEFYALLSQMTRELHDAHTRFRSPRLRAERKRQQATGTGLLISEVEGTPVVLSVTPESEAARAGIEPGMIVRTINGVPVAEKLLKAQEQIGSSSTERATRILAYRDIIAGEPETTIKLGLERADKTAFDVALVRHTVTAAPKITTRLLPSGDAYIKFNRFFSPAASQIKTELQKFKSAPGLIVDLRGNGGGDGEEMLRIAGFFFADKTPVGHIITRTGKAPSAAFGLIRIPLNYSAGHRGGQLYDKPVVILINEYTGSAAELFSGALQENMRARIVGSQSCGCVLGILNHREIKGGGELDISEIAFSSPKQRKYEGTGVIPDQSIALALDDLRHGRDTGLEAAEELLKRPPQNVSPSTVR